jgi:hypothetical protein
LDVLGAAAQKRKWSLKLSIRLTTTFAGNHASLPESWRRLEGATRCGFYSETPTGDQSLGSSFLTDEPNCLGSVRRICRFQGFVNYNDRELHYARRFSASMHYFELFTRIFTPVKICG